MSKRRVAFGGIGPEPCSPYANSEGQVIVAVSPICIYANALSQHGITSFWPSTNLNGISNLFLSNSFPLVNLPTYIAETVSETLHVSPDFYPNDLTSTLN